MRLSSAATVGILLGLALLLSACGEDGTTAADGPTSAGDTTSVPSPNTATRSSCRRLRPFLGSMAKLRDALARGLNYDDYLREVQGVRAIYARIDADKLNAGCLLAGGGPAERAFNLYIDATNTWGDCLASVSCSTRAIEPKLQRKWARAAHELTTAERGLGGDAGDVDRLGVCGFERLAGNAVETVPVDVEALQPGSRQRRLHLGFGKVALAVGQHLAGRNFHL